jgi:eukaryotic-like serine/threonine-protein kinase
MGSLVRATSRRYRCWFWMTGPPRSVGDTTVTSNDVPQPGDVLAGKYRVESVLGSGGMGVVLLVEHIELGQRMAVKLMTPGVIPDTQAVARFLREARSAAALHSEHVVRIFDVGTLESGAPYMVMELLRGEDLSQLLLHKGRLEIRDAVDYVLQACHAIAEAHAMGIVHRDLKPSNLFLTRRSDGTALVKVLDFGISKAMDSDSAGASSANLTATSAVMGSPLYMSPEQVRNAKQVDARADIWSLGVILHELLTGAHAFHADTLPGICAAIIADEPAPLRSLRADAPVGLEAVITKCLEKSARSRFQTTRDLMLAMRSFASTGMQLNVGAIPIAQTMREAGISSRNPQPSSKGASALDPLAPSAEMTVVEPSQPAIAPGSEAASLASSAVPVASSSSDVSKESPRRRSLLIAVAAALVLLAAITFAITTTREKKPDAPLAPAATLVPAPPASRKSFVLLIDSSPTGADVREGDRVIGTTPMQLSIDNDAVRAEPRKLTVQRDGFQRYSILQGASEDNVRIIASLVAQPAEAPPASAKSYVTKAPKPVPTPERVPAPPAATPPPATPPAATPPPGDIRLQR